MRGRIQAELCSGSSAQHSAQHPGATVHLWDGSPSLGWWGSELGDGVGSPMAAGPHRGFPASPLHAVSEAGLWPVLALQQERRCSRSQAGNPDSHQWVLPSSLPFPLLAEQRGGPSAAARELKSRTHQALLLRELDTSLLSFLLSLLLPFLLLPPPSHLPPPPSAPLPSISPPPYPLPFPPSSCSSCSSSS